MFKLSESKWTYPGTLKIKPRPPVGWWEKLQGFFGRKFWPNLWSIWEDQD